MRILIGNDKGGVGKTTASDFIISAYDAAGVPLAVGEIDREQKLSAMLKADGRKVDMTIAPPDTDQLVDSKELIRFFTPALTLWTHMRSSTPPP
jgi:cellulose biosynthesis protein BcsQ